jgi:hypothetical protein
MLLGWMAPPRVITAAITKNVLRSVVVIVYSSLFVSEECVAAKLRWAVSLWQLHSGAIRYRKARANSKVTKCDFLFSLFPTACSLGDHVKLSRCFRFYPDGSIRMDMGDYPVC